MSEAKIDRRIQRTRQILSQALRDLVLEKGYDAITIQDIVDRANVGRATFYAHYQDKDDLLLNNFQHFLDQIGQKMEAAVVDGKTHEEHQLIPSLALFRQVDNNFDRHKAGTKGRGGELVRDRLHEFLTEHLQKQLEMLLEDRQELEVPLTIVANHLISSLLTLLWWWVEHDRPYSPERMDEVFQRLTGPTVESVLGIDLY